jgi:hypothetical protein
MGLFVIVGLMVMAAMFPWWVSAGVLVLMIWAASSR